MAIQDNDLRDETTGMMPEDMAGDDYRDETTGYNNDEEMPDTA